MPRVHKTPSAMTSTPEEDQFFAKDRAASRTAEAEEEQDAFKEVRRAVEGSEETTEQAEPEAEPESGDGGEETEQEDTAAQETPGRTVPIGELYAERERRKASEGLQQQQAQRIQQLEETFKKVVDRIGGMQQAPEQQALPQIPAYDSDPLSHLKATQDLIIRQLSSNQEIQHQQTQWTQQQQAEQQIQAYILSAENQFRAVRPDYDAAAAYARDALVKELEIRYGNDQMRIAAAIKQNIIGIASDAYNSGKNPAEIYYEWAKLRGYQPPGAQPPAQAQPQRTGNGAQRLKQIAQAQAMSKAPRGGAAPAQELTLTDLSTMTDDDFDKNFDKFWKRT